MEYGEELIGNHVIVRSNESEPLLFGVFQGFTSDTWLPIVRDETGRDWLSMGIILPDTQVMRRALEPLTYEQQWAWLKDISICFQIVHGAAHKR